MRSISLSLSRSLDIVSSGNHIGCFPLRSSCKYWITCRIAHTTRNNFRWIIRGISNCIMTGSSLRRNCIISSSMLRCCLLTILYWSNIMRWLRISQAIIASLVDWTNSPMNVLISDILGSVLTPTRLTNISRLLLLNLISASKRITIWWCLFRCRSDGWNTIAFRNIFTESRVLYAIQLWLLLYDVSRHLLLLTMLSSLCLILIMTL